MESSRSVSTSSGCRRPFVVADQRAVRLAARGAEFIFVDFLEQLALVEFYCLGQIAGQFPLADVEHAQLQAGSGLAVHDQVVEPAPGTFQLGELRRVHDRVQLLGQLAVDLGDCPVEGAGQVAVEGDGARQCFLDQRLHQILRAIALGLLGGTKNLLEQVDALGSCRFRGSRGRCLCAGHGSAPLLVEAELAGQ